MIKHSMFARFGLSILAVGLFAAGCGDDDDDASDPNIVELATESGLNTLVQAAQTAGLAAALQEPGPLTVFAPTDAAFAAIQVPSDPGLLANVLLHHVVNGAQDSAAVLSQGPFTTLANTTLTVDASGTPITVGGAALSSTLDAQASNGIVHIMDEVIVPPTILEAAGATDDLSSLVAAVNAASATVQGTLASAGPLTVFAPNNTAFSASGIDLATVPQGDLDDILTYHVATGQTLSGDLTAGQTITMASGDTLTVNIDGSSITLTDASGVTVNVVTADLRLLNGVVHIIDGVLDPIPPGNIVEEATANGNFGTLLGAAGRAGLDTVLADPDSTFTVFAPTDAAFTALGVDLTPVSDDVIGNILLQHVIGSDVPGTEVLTSPTLTTEANLPLVVDASGSPITVGGATLSATIDQIASNGRIHVMDAVIVPPTIVEVAAATPDLSDLVAALQAATLVDAVSPDTLGGDSPITVFAPTNDAFATAGVSLSNPPGNLSEILQYHVVAGQVLSTDLTDGQVITTVEGTTLEVDIDASGNVSLIDEQNRSVAVGQTDIRTLTGVVHLLDNVLFLQP